MNATQDSSRPVDISIVIVNWNVSSFLRKCLQSVNSQETAWSWEVVVVDNASQDGSVAMLRSEFPSIQLIESQQNLGYGRANNLAIENSGGKYVLLLNPDTILHPGLLQGLADFLEQNPGYGAAGPKLLNADSSLQPSCYPFPTLGRELWRLFHLDRLRAYGVYDMSAWDEKRPRTVDALKGACILARRDALEQSGLFDLDYFMYTEEIDLCFRLQKAGWKIGWYPQAKVTHFGGESTQQVSEQSFLQLYQSKSLYFKKNHGAAAAALYRLILLLGSLPRILLAPFALLEKGSHRSHHMQLARSYLSLIRMLFDPSF